MAGVDSPAHIGASIRGISTDGLNKVNPGTINKLIFCLTHF